MLELSSSLLCCLLENSGGLLKKLRHIIEVSKSPQFLFYSLPLFVLVSLFPKCFPFSTDRTPGKIETLTDLLLEDFKSFGTCQELGEESAKFIRHELETTWGSSHLAVLDEQEAQKWLLGVSYLLIYPFVFCTSTSSQDPPFFYNPMPSVFRPCGYYV